MQEYEVAEMEVKLRRALDRSIYRWEHTVAQVDEIGQASAKNYIKGTTCPSCDVTKQFGNVRACCEICPIMQYYLDQGCTEEQAEACNQVGYYEFLYDTDGSPVTVLNNLKTVKEWLNERTFSADKRFVPVHIQQ